MVIMRRPDAMKKAGALNTKAQMINFSADWNSYFGILTQAIGVGGVLIFGFLASWIFGREYSDGTAKDLLAMPISRTKIINAKFIIYVAWCFALAFANLLEGLIIGSVLQISSTGTDSVYQQLSDYFYTTGMTILVGTPIAFFAIWGKGYLAPLGFVALTLVLAQIIAATGYGSYFPWSVPGLFSGAGGELKNQLDVGSYTILLLTAACGYCATVLYWKYSDQTQ